MTLPVTLLMGGARKGPISVKAFDPALASPFRMDWLVPLDSVTQDDYTRAVAEKAETILRSARFVEMNHQSEGTDMEIRIWVEAASASACVSITWEPGQGRFGFHLLDESLRERLGCVVFEGVPSVTAEASLSQADLILEAAMRAVLEAERNSDATELAERVRHATKTRRVPVVEGPVADSGVEP